MNKNASRENARPKGRDTDDSDKFVSFEDELCARSHARRQLFSDYESNKHCSKPNLDPEQLWLSGVNSSNIALPPRHMLAAQSSCRSLPVVRKHHAATSACSSAEIPKMMNNSRSPRGSEEEARERQRHRIRKILSTIEVENEALYEELGELLKGVDKASSITPKQHERFKAIEAAFSRGLGRFKLPGEEDERIEKALYSLSDEELRVESLIWRQLSSRMVSFQNMLRSQMRILLKARQDAGLPDLFNLNPKCLADQIVQSAAEVERICEQDEQSRKIVRSYKLAVQKIREQQERAGRLVKECMRITQEPTPKPSNEALVLMEAASERGDAVKSTLSGVTDFVNAAQEDAAELSREAMTIQTFGKLHVNRLVANPGDSMRKVSRARKGAALADEWLGMKRAARNVGFEIKGVQNEMNSGGVDDEQQRKYPSAALAEAAGLSLLTLRLVTGRPEDPRDKRVPALTVDAPIKVLMARRKVLDSLRDKEALVKKAHERINSSLHFRMEITVGKEAGSEVLRRQRVHNEHCKLLIERLRRAQEKLEALMSEAFKLYGKAKDLRRPWQLMIDIPAVRAQVEALQLTLRERMTISSDLDCRVMALQTLVKRAVTYCEEAGLMPMNVDQNTLQLEGNFLEGRKPEVCRETIREIAKAYLSRLDPKGPGLAIDSLENWVEQASNVSPEVAEILRLQGTTIVSCYASLKYSSRKTLKSKRSEPKGSFAKVLGTSESTTWTHVDTWGHDYLANWNLAWAGMCCGVAPRCSQLANMSSTMLMGLEDMVAAACTFGPKMNCKRVRPLSQYYNGSEDLMRQVEALDRELTYHEEYWQSAVAIRIPISGVSDIEGSSSHFSTLMVSVVNKCQGRVERLRSTIACFEMLRKATAPKITLDKSTLEPELLLFARSAVLKRLAWTLLWQFNDLAAAAETLRSSVSLHSVVLTLAAGLRQGRCKGGVFTIGRERFNCSGVEMSALTNTLLHNSLKLLRMPAELLDALSVPQAPGEKFVEHALAASRKLGRHPPEICYARFLSHDTLQDKHFMALLHRYESKKNNNLRGWLEMVLRGVKACPVAAVTDGDEIHKRIRLGCSALDRLITFWRHEVVLVADVFRGDQLCKWRKKLMSLLKQTPLVMKGRKTNPDSDTKGLRFGLPEELIRFEEHGTEQPSAEQIEDWGSVIHAEHRILSNMVDDELAALMFVAGTSLMGMPECTMRHIERHRRNSRGGEKMLPVLWGFEVASSLELELRIKDGFDHSKNGSQQTFVVEDAPSLIGPGSVVADAIEESEYSEGMDSAAVEEDLFKADSNQNDEVDSSDHTGECSNSRAAPSEGEIGDRRARSKRTFSKKLQTEPRAASKRTATRLDLATRPISKEKKSPSTYHTSKERLPSKETNSKSTDRSPSQKIKFAKQEPPPRKGGKHGTGTAIVGPMDQTARRPLREQLEMKATTTTVDLTFDLRLTATNIGCASEGNADVALAALLEEAKLMVREELSKAMAAYTNVVDEVEGIKQLEELSERQGRDMQSFGNLLTGLQLMQKRASETIHDPSKTMWSDATKYAGAAASSEVASVEVVRDYMAKLTNLQDEVVKTYLQSSAERRKAAQRQKDLATSYLCNQQENANHILVSAGIRSYVANLVARVLYLQEGLHFRPPIYKPTVEVLEKHLKAMENLEIEQSKVSQLLSTIYDRETQTATQILESASFDNYLAVSEMLQQVDEEFRDHQASIEMLSDEHQILERSNELEKINLIRAGAGQGARGKKQAQGIFTPVVVPRAHAQSYCSREDRHGDASEGDDSDSIMNADISEEDQSSMNELVQASEAAAMDAIKVGESGIVAMKHVARVAKELCATRDQIASIFKILGARGLFEAKNNVEGSLEVETSEKETDNNSEEDSDRKDNVSHEEAAVKQWEDPSFSSAAKAYVSFLVRGIYRSLHATLQQHVRQAPVEIDWDSVRDKAEGLVAALPAVPTVADKVRPPRERRFKVPKGSPETSSSTLVTRRPRGSESRSNNSPLDASRFPFDIAISNGAPDEIEHVVLNAVGKIEWTAQQVLPELRQRLNKLLPKEVMDLVKMASTNAAQGALSCGEPTLKAAKNAAEQVLQRGGGMVAAAKAASDTAALIVETYGGSDREVQEAGKDAFDIVSKTLITGGQAGLSKRQEHSMIFRLAAEDIISRLNNVGVHNLQDVAAKTATVLQALGAGDHNTALIIAEWAAAAAVERAAPRAQVMAESTAAAKAAGASKDVLWIAASDAAAKSAMSAGLKPQFVGRECAHAAEAAGASKGDAEKLAKCAVADALEVETANIESAALLAGLEAQACGAGQAGMTEIIIKIASKFAISKKRRPSQAVAAALRAAKRMGVPDTKMLQLASTTAREVAVAYNCSEDEMQSVMEMARISAIMSASEDESSLISDKEQQELHEESAQEIQNELEGILKPRRVSSMGRAPAKGWTALRVASKLKHSKPARGRESAGPKVRESFSSKERSKLVHLRFKAEKELETVLGKETASMLSPQSLGLIRKKLEDAEAFMDEGSDSSLSSSSSPTSFIDLGEPMPEAKDPRSLRWKKSARLSRNIQRTLSISHAQPNLSARAMSDPTVVRCEALSKPLVGQQSKVSPSKMDTSVQPGERTQASMERVGNSSLLAQQFRLKSDGEVTDEPKELSLRERRRLQEEINIEPQYSTLPLHQRRLVEERAAKYNIFPQRSLVGTKIAKDNDDGDGSQEVRVRLPSQTAEVDSGGGAFRESMCPDPGLKSSMQANSLSRHLLLEKHLERRKSVPKESRALVLKTMTRLVSIDKLQVQLEALKKKRDETCPQVNKEDPRWTKESVLISKLEWNLKSREDTTLQTVKKSKLSTYVVNVVMQLMTLKKAFLKWRDLAKGRFPEQVDLKEDRKVLIKLLSFPGREITTVKIPEGHVKKGFAFGNRLAAGADGDGVFGVALHELVVSGDSAPPKINGHQLRELAAGAQTALPVKAASSTPLTDAIHSLGREPSAEMVDGVEGHNFDALPPELSHSNLYLRKTFDDNSFGLVNEELGPPSPASPSDEDADEMMLQLPQVEMLMEQLLKSIGSHNLTNVTGNVRDELDDNTSLSIMHENVRKSGSQQQVLKLSQQCGLPFAKRLNNSSLPMSTSPSEFWTHSLETQQFSTFSRKSEHDQALQKNLAWDAHIAHKLSEDPHLAALVYNVAPLDPIPSSLLPQRLPQGWLPQTVLGPGTNRYIFTPRGLAKPQRLEALRVDTSRALASRDNTFADPIPSQKLSASAVWTECAKEVAILKRNVQEAHQDEEAIFLHKRCKGSSNERSEKPKLLICGTRS